MGLFAQNRGDMTESTIWEVYLKEVRQKSQNVNAENTHIINRLRELRSELNKIATEERKLDEEIERMDREMSYMKVADPTRKEDLPKDIQEWELQYQKDQRMMEREFERMLKKENKRERESRREAEIMRREFEMEEEKEKLRKKVRQEGGCEPLMAKDVERERLGKQPIGPLINKIATYGIWENLAINPAIYSVLTYDRKRVTRADLFNYIVKWNPYSIIWEKTYGLWALLPGKPGTKDEIWFRGDEYNLGFANVGQTKLSSVVPDVEAALKNRTMIVVMPRFVERYLNRYLTTGQIPSCATFYNLYRTKVGGVAMYSPEVIDDVIVNAMYDDIKKSGIIRDAVYESRNSKYPTKWGVDGFQLPPGVTFKSLEAKIWYGGVSII